MNPLVSAHDLGVALVSFTSSISASSSSRPLQVSTSPPSPPSSPSRPSPPSSPLPPLVPDTENNESKYSPGRASLSSSPSRATRCLADDVLMCFTSTSGKGDNAKSIQWQVTRDLVNLTRGDEEKFTCDICLQIFDTPVSHQVDGKKTCSHVFCLNCIHPHLVNRKHCPKCFTGSSAEGLVSEVDLAKQLADIVARCTFYDKGCNWKGAVGTCGSTRGRAFVEHANSCPSNGKPCDECKTYVAFGDEKEHDDVCLAKPVSCMNTKCSIVVKRENLKRHSMTEECKHYLRPCIYGCSGRYDYDAYKKHRVETDDKHCAEFVRLKRQLDTRVLDPAVFKWMIPNWRAIDDGENLEEKFELAEKSWKMILSKSDDCIHVLLTLEKTDRCRVILSLGIDNDVYGWEGLFEHCDFKKPTDRYALQTLRPAVEKRVDEFGCLAILLRIYCIVPF